MSKSTTRVCRTRRFVDKRQMSGSFVLRSPCGGRVSGGGGNRTRVPRYFHESLYVRSRLFKSHSFSRLSARLLHKPAGSFFSSLRALRGSKRSGITTDIRAPPAGPLSQGCLFRQPLQDLHLQLKFLVSFLRGQLTNHGTPPSLLTTRSIPIRPHLFKLQRSFCNHRLYDHHYVSTLSPLPA